MTGVRLVVSGVSVAVGGRRLLSGISFSLSDSDILYILGPNGAGKTSLLKALMGVPGYEIVEGTVLLDGEDIRRLSIYERARRGLALAFQIPPRLRGIKAGDLLAQICRKTGCDHREVAKIAGVEHLLDREVCRLSGGESKRVELATVLAQRPRVALIDEPDSGVDVDSLSIIARALRELLNSAAVVVVTHGAHIAKYLTPSKVCVLHFGTLRRCGGAEVIDEVLTRGFSQPA
jgi:Fe-S cluster assembly ATP-binding protein